MGFLNKLFGKKTAPASQPDDKVSNNVDNKVGEDFEDEDDDQVEVDSSPISGPPEFVRAVDLQRNYWKYQAAKQAQLAARGWANLDWNERLRLHHLNCLQRLAAGKDRAATNELCLQSLRGLQEPGSPYLPRPAMIWQGKSEPDSEPNLQGRLLNPSYTHLGALEIYDVDADNQPIAINFVSFDELTGVLFGPPGIIRMAKLFFEGGGSRIVQVPLLYGPTWSAGSEYERAGRMTRFVAHFAGEKTGIAGPAGIGVGQQDFIIQNASGGANLFGLGSVAEISFPLEMSDPRFDERARARGIDPDKVRMAMAKGEK